MFFSKIFSFLSKRSLEVKGFTLYWTNFPIVILILASLLALLAFDVYLRIKAKADDDQKLVLNLLQKLNDIILSSLTNVEEVAQKVSDAVAFDLGFQVGVILLKDEKRQILRRIAISRTERVEKAVARLGFHFKGLETPFESKNNITVQVAMDNIPRTTNSIYEVLKPHVTEEQAKYIQEVGELAVSLVYPLSAKGKTIGVMIISLSKHDSLLTEMRKRIIERVLKVVGIALDNALVYQNLKETSQKLEIANQRLKELDQLKDEFVSVASHELRTPMTAIRSYVRMALHKLGIPLSQKLERYLYRTLVSAERLISLVNDMLNVSRIESGHIEISPKAFDIVALVKDIMEEVKVKADEKSLRLISLEQKIPAVFADGDKVHEILLNLLGNALKFSYPGGTVTVSFFTDGQMVDLSVKDSGCGITKEDLSKLFHKFSRLDNSYTSVSTSGGTGLGLYISKNLVELMHGKIWVSSEGLDKGSTFSFSLPIANEQVLKHADEFKVKAEGEAKPLESVAI